MNNIYFLQKSIFAFLPDSFQPIYFFDGAYNRVNYHQSYQSNDGRSILLYRVKPPYDDEIIYGGYQYHDVYEWT